MPATLAELEARISALEQQRQPAPPDYLTNNFQVVNPDGTINAQFSGHIIAQGVDLQAAESAFTTAHEQARWLDSSGVPVGIIDSLIVTDRMLPPNQIARRLSFMACDQGGTRQAGIIADAIADTLTAGAGANAATVLDGQDRSIFMRWLGGAAATPTNLRVQVGIVNGLAVSGIGTKAFPLVTPWSVAHSALVAWVNNAANFSAIANVYGSYANGVSGGAIALNSTIAQNISVGYISFGV